MTMLLATTLVVQNATVIEETLLYIKYIFADLNVFKEISDAPVIPSQGSATWSCFKRYSSLPSLFWLPPLHLLHPLLTSRHSPCSNLTSSSRARPSTMPRSSLVSILVSPAVAKECFQEAVLNVEAPIDFIELVLEHDKTLDFSDYKLIEYVVANGSEKAIAAFFRKLKTIRTKRKPDELFGHYIEILKSTKPLPRTPLLACVRPILWILFVTC